MTGVLITLGKRDIVEEGGAARVAERAGAKPCDVVRIDDLASLALQAGPRAWARVFEAGQPLVVGCSRPRAARALLQFAGVAWRAERVAWLQLAFDAAALKSEYGVPWYPVIDRELCTRCGTCADYCLFSVYAKPKDGAIRVAAPQNCKTGCPACARLCPTGALIFPFCADAELNGAIERPAPRARDALAEALGYDPLRALAERRNRGRLLDPAKFEQAERDRVTYSGVL